MTSDRGDRRLKRCVRWAKARSSAFTRVFARYGRAHAFLLGAKTWARRFAALPTLRLVMREDGVWR